MINKAFLLVVAITFGVAIKGYAEDPSVLPEHQTANTWYAQAADNLAAKPQFESQRKAKNIILFVGDGMGISTVTAARIFEGQLAGQPGEENNLSFDLFPFTGLIKTYNVDAQTPDSAGTMTAIMSGVKTDTGVVGVDESVERGVCSSLNNHKLVTALELAELAGKSTGIVTTTRVTHATPAATYAKSVDRNWEDISDIPTAQRDKGCTDIAMQLVRFEQNLKAQYPAAKNVDGIDVIMGGGRRHFLPNDASHNSNDAVSSIEGDRTDGLNLTTEWLNTYPNGYYITDQAGFNAVDPAATQKVFALFNESHMQFEEDRFNDIAGEPSLTEMTTKAIQILDNNDKGFFLSVESGRIDHAHHAGSAYGALTETVEFSNAVRAAIENTNPEETLILVTADHSHVFTIAGYPKRGNPILGKVVHIGEDQPATANDGLPYTTVGYMNGAGFAFLEGETDPEAIYDASGETGRADLTHVNTEDPGFHQESLIPTGSETHAGEDVAVYATGPGAAGVIGTSEQSILYHVMNAAGDLEKKAAEGLYGNTVKTAK